jgi:hypothetical protein
MNFGGQAVKDALTHAYLETILTLLEQQRANLQRCPFTPEQLEKDKQFSARLRQLSDQLPADDQQRLRNTLISITPPFCPL